MAARIRRLIDDRIEFGFRQAGFVGEQFELCRMNPGNPVGLRCEPREGFQPAMFLEYGDAALLFANVFLLFGDDL